MFVGRELELAQLRDCARAVTGGQPRVVLVEGEAGIGKTQLVRHWLTDPFMKDFVVLQARCDPSEQDLAFGPIQQLISATPGTLLDDFPLLKGPIPATMPPYEVGRQLLELTSALQARRPIALVVDDLQWADTASLHAWGFVLRRLDADALLVALTLRTTHRERDPKLEEMLRRLVTDVRGNVRLPLEGLATGQVAELIEGTTGQPVSEANAARMRRHTGGNPLYVTSLLAELPKGDLAGAPVTALPVPLSLATAIHGQLLNLPEPSRALAEAAAVLGTPMPLALVGKMAGVKAPAAALEAALEAGLMRWLPNEPSAPVELTHELQRQAVIEAIPPDRLRQLHAKAEHLVDRHAAWAHRVGAAGPTDLRLAAELVTAADEEFAAGDADRSATLLLYAADLEATRVQRERHLLTAVARLAAFERYTRIATLLTRVRATEPCAMRCLVLGADAMNRGMLAAAEAHYAEAVARSEEEGDTWTGLMAQVAMSGVLNFLGRHDEGIRAARQALAIDPDMSWALVNLSTGLALAEGAPAALRELAQVTPEVVRSAARGKPAGAHLLTVQGAIRITAGSLTAGIEDCALAVRLSRSHGVPALADFAYGLTAAAQYLLGDWDDVPISVDHAHAITSNGDGKAAAYDWEYSAAVWLAAGRGEWDRAEEHLRAAESRSGLEGNAHNSTLMAISRAVLAQARGDQHAMLQAVEPLLQAEAGWPRHLQVFWLPLHSEALIAAGRLDQAATAVARLQATAARDIPCLRTAAAWLSGRLAERLGDTARARTIYEQGLSPGPQADVVLLHRAMLEHAHGRIMHLEGQTADAAKWLDQARHRLEKVRARPFLERLAGDIPTPRTPSVPGPANPVALSGRERDIAHLIGRGLTNKEIANELFVSSKTVEYHLSHIYLKFGFSNRRELRDHVQRGALSDASS
ncbi:AAA family ATPase (plasmid) [Streptomyces sp. HUAS 31]|uniref:helix-turn-helix transcriptional regulator n=1 Tax=Streptomyces sp. HUAS 31 TaxID=3020055 RepID=UPI00230699EE|nr:AAA family ATPase [Streptomyces sp. HUAS 31]WCE02497.1 AAA family ATPase [Streptomyces sp. HUAS 31]